LCGQFVQEQRRPGHSQHPVPVSPDGISVKQRFWHHGPDWGRLFWKCCFADTEKRLKLQSAIHFLFPPQCMTCGAQTTSDFALCGACWRDMPFISGLVCDACGVPLPGGTVGETEYCDACLTTPRPWRRGRAAVTYDGSARRLILALKHGDRLDLAYPMADWMAEAARALPRENTLIVPVPLYWRRLLMRRCNQAALLAGLVAKRLRQPYCPDVLHRIHATRMQQSMTREERFENQRAAFVVAKRHHAKIAGKNVLLVDDVLTSGATLSACTEACLTAGAQSVNVLVLARVARDT